jgi:preprotein translocase subunit YajC
MKKSEIKQLIKEVLEDDKRNLHPTSQKTLDRKAYKFITSDTPIEVGMGVVSKYGGLFGEIKKISNDNYFIQFDIDYVDEKPQKNSRKQLEKYFLIKTKK